METIVETNQDLKTFEVGGNVEWLRADKVAKGDKIRVVFEAAELAKDTKGGTFPAFIVKENGILFRLSGYSVVTETGRPLPVQDFIGKTADLVSTGQKWAVKFA